MKQNQLITHVILTGGVGSRLWPLSRKSYPKQYIEIFNGVSLFEMTIERNRGIAGKIIVVGNVDNSRLSRIILEKSGIEYIEIIESTPRNTAAAIAFAAFATQPDDILLVTPSDHLIENKASYLEAVKDAISIAVEGSIVAFGIKPCKPETGYGYIEFDSDKVLAFHEKPALDKAIEYLQKNSFYWNSGMFCFKAAVFLQELENYAPEIYKNSKLAWEANKKGHLNLEMSLRIPSISADYAVMEYSKKIKVIPSQFGWSDLGSFESVYDYLIKLGHPSDENGNITIGTEIHTSFIGLESCIFVHTTGFFDIEKREIAGR